MSSPHDRWLAAYHHSVEQMWCANNACANHADSITVDYEEENGQGSTQPEECPLCGGELSWFAPSDAA